MKLFRERYGDGGADAHGALQRDLGVMALGHVLDDGEPQTGAAGGTAVAFVYPVEPLKDPLLMLRGNADAGVADGDAVILQGYGDGAVDPVIADGIVR